MRNAAVPCDSSVPLNGEHQLNGDGDKKRSFVLRLQSLGNVFEPSDAIFCKRFFLSK